MRRRHAERRAARRCGLARAHEPRARARPANDTMTVEAGCVLAEPPGSRRRGRPLFPLSLGAEGSCRSAATSRPMPAARRCCATASARPRARARSGAARRRDLERPARAAQGQHRLRPEAPVHRRRRHARHHHRGGVQAFPAARVDATAFVGVADPEAAVALLSPCAPSRRCGHDVRADAADRARPGAAAHSRDERSADRHHPWYVLVEIGMGRSSTAARESIEAELAAAMESGEIADAAIAESEAQREMFWRPARNDARARRRGRLLRTLCCRSARRGR